MAVIEKNLGPVSAYAVAVANGYEGTEEQWAAEIAAASQNAQAAAGSATEAAGSAAAAAQSVIEANAAKTAAQQAAESASAAYGTDLLAATFSADAPYVSGQYVIYNGGLYVFTADHPAGAWIGTDARRVQVGGELTDLKSAITQITDAKIITWVEDAYIKTNQSVGTTISLTPNELAGYRYAIIDCKEGDTFTINANGATTPRAWAFVDNTNALIVQSGANSVNVDFILTAPYGANKLILNDKAVDGNYSEPSYIGIPVGSSIKALRNEVWQTIEDGVVELPFKRQHLSNLITANITKRTNVIATDMINLYGEYSIDFPSDYKVFVATFPSGFDSRPSISGLCTGWITSGHLGILANGEDKYVVEIMRTDEGEILPSEASNITIKKVSYDDFEELAIKNWVQGTVDEGGSVVSRTTRISSADALAFPFRGTFKIKLTSGYALGIRSGARSINMPTNTYWLLNGDDYTVPDGHNYFRMILAKYTGSSNPDQTIIPDDAKAVECALRWDKAPTVTDGNDTAIKLIDAASLIFNTSGTNGKRAVIAHTSDVHGDAVRLKRFADFCDAYGVDYAAMTGDFTAYNVEDGVHYLQNIILDHGSQFGVCLGNHDVRGVVTDAEVYNYFMSPIATKLGNTTGKNYYYKDIDSQKLRIISVSEYEEGIVSSGVRRTSDQHMSSEQLAWICATLKSTPENYGVIIMMHAIQAATPSTEGYTTFYQNPLKFARAGNTALGGSPVFDIVDAFVSRATISESYDQSGTPTPISVSDDFSSVDASIEFIAFMVGHFHSDAITYTSSTVNKLLVLNVTCTNSIYGGETYPYLADVSDLHRNNKLQSQDAFNLYAIDRSSKVVHVVRVGANTPYTMSERQYMAIPYIAE